MGGWSHKESSQGRQLETIKQSASPFLMALTASELAAYDLFLTKSSVNHAIQLNRNLAVGQDIAIRSDRILHTIIKNACIIITRERSITPLEMLLSKGFPVRCGLANPRCETSLSTCCSFCTDWDPFEESYEASRDEAWYKKV